MWELLHQYRTLFIAAYVVVILVLAVYGFHRSHLVYLYFKNRKRGHTPERRFDDLPVVTVQLPIFNEMYVVERLIEAVAAIDYPHDKLEIQVLDDSTDETREIAARKCAEVRARGLDCKHLSRPTRVGYKAGALDFGLHCARGEFVAVFDADFVPNPSFLRDMIDHFTDAGVGMVQARWGHLNGDYSGLTRVQSIMLDGHFIIEHTARNRSGRFFNFNGTAGIWRRQAIEDAGGWQHDTLTEDLDLSYRAQMKGWRFIYLPDVVSPAEIPCEMNSFKSQQFRWAKGSLQTAKKILPLLFRSDLPWKVKIEAAFHLSNNVAYLFLVLLSLLLLPMLAVRGEHGWREVLLLDMPLFFGTTLSIAGFYVMTQRLGDTPVTLWQAIRRVPLALSLGIGLSINQSRAVLEGLWGGPSEFVRTPKHGMATVATAAATAGGGDSGGPVPVPASWVSKRYRAAKNLVPVIEILFATYFLATIAVAIRYHHFSSLPFLLLFLGGYLYVGVLSIHQRR
ncbi:MAG TPA: cellulose synthase family protein [Myxococcota bacterium]|jgi:cellulose synthase/poly-beta-1,6-N-acetylglucosamine synthase-like glycosyltransferase|nr:cellulose synthase family protein [Myxococcota bacterium]